MPVPFPDLLERMPVPPPGPVVVAMSGGVDSSVTAALLKAWGYQVHGIMLRLWSETGRAHLNRCCTIDAQHRARWVAKTLGIPFEVLDARDAFYHAVVQHFLDRHRQGQTPNPCPVCNREVRWGFLWTHARSLGARALATGHYARVLQEPGGPVLRRGIDPAKDQSYVLSRLTRDQLAHTLLPLGFLTKPRVRQWAQEQGLPSADQPESQDLCFLGGDGLRGFLQRHLPGAATPGPIVHLKGTPLGQHQGLAFYTLGQRRGLGISSGERLYVVHKDPARNRLVVGPPSARFRRSFRAQEAHWLLDPPPRAPFLAEVQIRATAPARPARVVPLGTEAFEVHFLHPVADPTPGQLAVVYQGDRCLGSGEIHEVPPPAT